MFEQLKNLLLPYQSLISTHLAIVDDSEDYLFLLKEQVADLKLKGNQKISIDCFSNGEDFLKAYRPRKYSTVILDANLPRMSGWEVAKAIIKYNSAGPVIMIATGDYQYTYYADQADEIILKPYRLEDILKVGKKYKNNLLSNWVHIAYRCQEVLNKKGLAAV